MFVGDQWLTPTLRHAAEAVWNVSQTALVFKGLYFASLKASSFESRNYFCLIHVLPLEPLQVELVMSLHRIYQHCTSSSI